MTLKEDREAVPRTAGQIAREIRVDQWHPKYIPASTRDLIDDCLKAGDVENLARLCRVMGKV